MRRRARFCKVTIFLCSVRAQFPQSFLTVSSKAVSRFDEILVAETDEEDHLHTLSLVLERHLNAGFRLTRQSARFFFFNH